MIQEEKTYAEKAFEEVKALRTSVDLQLKTTATKEELETSTKRFLDVVNADVKPTLEKLKADVDEVRACMSRPSFEKANLDLEVKDRAEFNRICLDRSAKHSHSWSKAFMRAAELKAMVTDDMTAGGYRTIISIASQIYENLMEFSPIRANADVESIQGDLWVGMKDEGAFTTRAKEERGTAAETTVQTFGEIEIPIKQREIYPMASQRMLDMANFDVAGMLLRKGNRQFLQDEGTDFITGNGVSLPEGITVNAILTTLYNSTTAPYGYIKTAQAAALPSGDDFASKFLSSGTVPGLFALLKGGYNARAKLFMNCATFFAFLCYRYGDGKFIFDPATAIAGPKGWNLWGKSVVECPQWPDIGANAFPLGYGDLSSAYKIVDNPKTNLIVDPYTVKGYVGYYWTRYYGGKIVLPEAFRLVKCEA